MEFRPLGRTDLNVSSLCLGTMTWSEQNTEADAFAQIDMAKAAGINFIDTAEMYPVPPRPETYATTEQYIGTYFKSRGDRADWILATKIAGPGNGISHIRNGRPRFNREHIRTALDDSLRRLQTDWIDLYQLHWPERSTNFSGVWATSTCRTTISHLWKKRLPPLMTKSEPVESATLAFPTRPLGRHEVPATGRDAQMAARRLDTKPYNLLNRSFEVGLAEISMREQCGLLAYSPLAFGMLSGKYENGACPANARLSLFQRFARYNNPQARAACSRYVALAHQHGLEPAQMALAYVTSRPFVTSNIIGATTLQQLESNIGSLDLTLSNEVLAAIDAIHTAQPNPAP